MAPLIACAAKLIPSRKTQRSHSLARPTSFFCHLRKISLAKTRKKQRHLRSTAIDLLVGWEVCMCGAERLFWTRAKERNAFLLHEGSFTSDRLAFVEQPTRRLISARRDKKTRMYWIISMASSNALNATHDFCAWHSKVRADQSKSLSASANWSLINAVASYRHLWRFGRRI